MVSLQGGVDGIAWKGCTWFVVLAVLATFANAATLDGVRARRAVACGVVTQAQDWTSEDAHGDLSPLTAELCRAVAAAIFGRPEAAAIARFPAENEGLAALAAAKLDVLIGATPSIGTANLRALVFGPVIFWDQQGFLVRRSSGIHGLSDLAGHTVCYLDGTDAGRTLLSAVQARHLRIMPFPFQEEGEMDAAFIGGHCAVVTAQISRLSEIRAQFPARVAEFLVLPDRLAVVPAAIVTRRGDPAWDGLVAATMNALIQARMLDVSQESVARLANTDSPAVGRLLGTDWSAAAALGLPRDWARRAIAAVGNYGEIFDRTLGHASPRGLAPDLNADCLHGGALCAVPVR